MEENVESGGFGERVLTFADDYGLPVRILSIAVPDEYCLLYTSDVYKRQPILELITAWGYSPTEG